MTKFSNKLKKTCFGGKKKFPGKSSSGMLNFTWDPSTMPNLEKINDAVPRKHPDRWQDGQTLFQRTLPATASSPIKRLT